MSKSKRETVIVDIVCVTNFFRNMRKGKGGNQIIQLEECRIVFISNGRRLSDLNYMDEAMS